MKKTDSALLGAALFSLIIIAYGLKNNKGWKYWLFMMLFMPNVGLTLGYALGKEETPKTTDLEHNSRNNSGDLE